MSAPNITEWIGALGTVFLGALGAGITIWATLQTRFHARVSALIEFDNRTVAVRITNRSNSAGMVSSVEIVHAHTYRANEYKAIPSKIDGGPSDRDVLPLYLPPGALASLVLIPVEAASFPRGVGVVIEWGAGRTCVRPTTLAPSRRLERRSLLPPNN